MGHALICSISIASYLLSTVTAQIPTITGSCIEDGAQCPIDLKRLQGQWYEVEATPNFMEYAYKCVSIRLGAFFEKKAEVKIDAVNRITKETGTIFEATASIPDNSNGMDGRLSLVFSPSTASFEGNNRLSALRAQFKEMNVTVLAADYAKWVLVYSCKQHGLKGAHTNLLWVLSRDQEMGPEEYAAIQQAKRLANVEPLKTRETIVRKCHSHIPEGEVKPGQLTFNDFMWTK